MGFALPRWKMREQLRGARYGEILIVAGRVTHLEAEVYNTIGCNDCPQALWSALDAQAIRRQHHAHAVILNGPRHFLMDSNAISDAGEPVAFGGLQLRLLATVEMPLGTLLGGGHRAPYHEHTVARTTRYSFRAGRQVYELLAASGAVYRMQSYALIVDPALREEDLGALGPRLDPPRGWSYRVRVLDKEEVLETDGRATVLQDDLQNTYQRLR